MTNPFDLKAVAAALGDHLAAGGAPIAQELLESGLAKILPTLQSMAQTGEQTALNSLADRETQGLDWLTQFAAGNRLKGTATVGGTVISFTVESEPKEKTV